MNAGKGAALQAIIHAWKDRRSFLFWRQRKRWRYLGSFVLLSDDLTPLSALANLNSWYFSRQLLLGRFPLYSLLS